MERRANVVDILLILEGTFPYVRGGVSSWVKRMIEGFDDYRFGIIFLGSARSDYSGREPYTLPSNVDYFSEYFLYDERSEMLPTRKNQLSFRKEEVLAAHQEMQNCLQGGSCPLHGLVNNFGVSHSDFLSSRAIWDYFLERYQEIPDQPSFVDYFWTIRGMHAPLWYLQQAFQAAPQTKIVLCPSTGYAGYLGALLAAQRRYPLIIAEHGIYTKERRIDLMLARWIHEDEDFLHRLGQIHYLRQLWIHFFEFLGRMSYQQAKIITNLYGGVIPLQVAGGAPPERLMTIPNGIQIEPFIPVRRDFAEKEDIVALIGRVVPIKDIKTFIRAAGILWQQGRKTQYWIVGPTEEDEEYYAECRILVEHLELQDCVQFLGFRLVTEVLARVRLTVLSSISEGLPLSVLESFAAGVPVVTTDVGSCRELLYGSLQHEPEEAAGAGVVVPIADPSALARAIGALLDDVERWKVCSQAGIRRVEAHYREDQMFAQYRQLFAQMLTE